MIRDEQAKNPNKLMVWTKNSGALRLETQLKGDEQNAADGHLRWTGDRRSAMVKHIAIAHDYCISAGNRCQQKKRHPEKGKKQSWMP